MIQEMWKDLSIWDVAYLGLLLVCATHAAIRNDWITAALWICILLWVVVAFMYRMIARRQRETMDQLLEELRRSYTQ